MNKIVVPTDFSTTAGAALRYAFYLAEATGFHLDVVHVHDGYGHSEATDIRKGSMEARQFAQRAIDQFLRFTLPAVAATDEGADTTTVRISSRDVIGSPTDALIAASQEETSRLIVMGGVGSGVVSTVTPYFGSVARAVAEGADCPVLLVPNGQDQPKIERAALAFNTVGELRQISHGFDFLRVPLAPSMRLVHVRDFSEKKEARKEIELMEDILNTGFPGYPVELDLLKPGDTALRLLEYPEEQDISLLVMGRRKRGFLQRLFAGSEVTKVLEYGLVPMLVVPVT